MHNGTLISDLQSLVTKFGSGGVDSDTLASEVGTGTNPVKRSLVGASEECVRRPNLDEPRKRVSGIKGACHSSSTQSPLLNRSPHISQCNSDPLPIQSSPDLSSASPSAGEGYLDRICNNCGQPHGKHSHIDDACPEPYLVGPMYSTTEFFDSGKRCEMCGQAEEDHGNGWRCL